MDSSGILSNTISHCVCKCVESGLLFFLQDTVTLGVTTTRSLTCFPPHNAFVGRHSQVFFTHRKLNHHR